uniref:protein NYNRIN-like n=1 Tax=Pristiophorus japonicus TaxID=55135 RepID=UPI00398F3790
MQDSLKLLQHLCERGHRVSLPKLQFCQTQVQYLGFHISQGQRQLGPERIQTIQSATIPKTKKDILSFLGMVGYCKQWIPDYREWDAVLRSAALNYAPPKVEWTPEREEAFKQLKKAITNAPALGLPNYDKPFQMYVNEKEGFATAVLTQEHGGGNRPVAYYSVLLPPVVRGMPACLRAVAATAVMVEKSVPIVLDYPCAVITAHAVLLLLNSAATQHFTASRRTGYEVLLLSHPNYTFRCAPVVNPATFLPTKEVEDPDQHDCLLTVEIAILPRPDLLTEPMDNPDLILYTDGPSYRPSDDLLLAGYAILNPHETVEAFALPPGTSAQAAELFALTRACIIAKDQTANIYTDSRYAFGVVHDFGQLWKNRGFITSGGKHIKHSQLVLNLLDVIQLPSKVAVIKCAAHTTGEDEVSVRNRKADEAAKQAASAQADCLQAVSVSPPQVLDIQQLKTAQQQVTMQERRTWENQGCFLKNDIWCHPDGRTVCPRSLFLPLSRLAHGQAHMGKGGMIHAINAQWYAPGITVVIEKVARTCQICQQNNRGKTPAEYDHLPQPSMPFENVQIDFVHMPPVSGLKYLLVIIDMFTRWVEAYATRRDDARIVVKILFKEIVPRYGIPMGINSDRGTHFTGKIVQNLAEALGFQWKLHIPYQPQSSGMVERVNGIIKSTLTKVCQETGLKWPDALPLVLYTMRNQKNRNTGLTPQEALLGRPMPTGVKPPLAAEKIALIWNDEKSLKYA